MMKKMILIMIMSIYTIIKADLPVHCLKSHITGEWEFRFSKLKKYAKFIENNCGH